MSWLGANEVFLMEVVSRDRIDDLRSTIDVTDESADGADKTPREIHEGAQYPLASASCSSTRGARGTCPTSAGQMADERVAAYLAGSVGGGPASV